MTCGLLNAYLQFQNFCHIKVMNLFITSPPSLLQKFQWTLLQRVSGVALVSRKVLPTQLFLLGQLNIGLPSRQGVFVSRKCLTHSISTWVVNIFKIFTRKFPSKKSPTFFLAFLLPSFLSWQFWVAASWLDGGDFIATFCSSTLVQNTFLLHLHNQRFAIYLLTRIF